MSPVREEIFLFLSIVSLSHRPLMMRDSRQLRPMKPVRTKRKPETRHPRPGSSLASLAAMYDVDHRHLLPADRGLDGEKALLPDSIRLGRKADYSMAGS